MKTVKRIIAVLGLILFIFAISYLVYTAKEVDFDAIPPETEIEQTEITEHPLDAVTEEVESTTGG
jgi:hypothetical protein